MSARLASAILKHGATIEVWSSWAAMGFHASECYSRRVWRKGKSPDRDSLCFPRAYVRGFLFFSVRGGENTALSNPIDKIVENGMCAYKHPDEYLPNGLHHQHPKVSQVCRIHKYPGQSRYGVVGMQDTSAPTAGQDPDTEAEAGPGGAAKKHHNHGPGALGFGTYHEEFMTNQWLTTNNQASKKSTGQHPRTADNWIKSDHEELCCSGGFCEDTGNGTGSLQFATTGEERDGNNFKCD